MEFGICLQTVIPVRSEPSHKSEMVTQVLFGELFRISISEHGWARVQLSYDDYTGWLALNQVQLLAEKDFLQLFNAETAVSLDLVQLVSNQTRNTIAPIIIGSSLPGCFKGDFTMLNDHYFYDGEVSEISPFDIILTRQDHLKAKHAIISDAMLYLNAPYLWGDVLLLASIVQDWFKWYIKSRRSSYFVMLRSKQPMVNPSILFQKPNPVILLSLTMMRETSLMLESCSIHRELFMPQEKYG
jgi:hypothetical protein